MKILVVDDELEKCRLYKDELEEEGYEVVVARTGVQALELFESETPDLVTLDIKMSYNDEGIQLLRHMKKLNPKLPIIMLTAFDYRDEFSLWAADAYILKSSDLTELKNTIKSVLC